MDLKDLTDDELELALRELQSSSPAGAKAADQLQGVLHELQVYRMELEMQNRALRESQAELENSVRRQNDLYDFSPIGYLTLSQAGMIENANLTAAELLHTERTRLKGLRFARFFDPAHHAQLVTHLDQALAGKPAVVSVTLRPFASDGALAVQLSSRLAPPIEEEPPQVLTAVTDVSELKQVQQQLEEVNREQEAFCHSISHDLRSPLITISNFSSLLIAELPEGMTEARQFLTRIQFATQRMDRMLGDLLEYSRVSRSSFEGSVVDVEKVVDDVVTQHHGVIQEAQAVITVKRPLQHVHGSPEALRQVLANLLTNALKFVAHGKNPEVEIWTEEAEMGILLLVKDHDRHRARTPPAGFWNV